MSDSQQSRKAIIKAFTVFALAVFLGGYVGWQHSNAIVPIVFISLGAFLGWIVYKVNRPKLHGSDTGTASSEQ